MTNASGSTAGRNEEERRDDRRRDAQATRFNLAPPQVVGQAHTFSAAELVAIQEQWDEAFPGELAVTSLAV